MDAIASRDGDLPRDGRDGIVWLGSTAASAALVGRDVARRDLVLVGGKGCQYALHLTREFAGRKEKDVSGNWDSFGAWDRLTKSR